MQSDATGSFESLDRTPGSVYFGDLRMDRDGAPAPRGAPGARGIGGGGTPAERNAQRERELQSFFHAMRAAFAD